MLSMSEFGGLQKHEKTQHSLVSGLGSAANAAAVALLTKVRGPEFPESDNKVYTKNKTKNETLKLLTHNAAHLINLMPKSFWW